MGWARPREKVASSTVDHKFDGRTDSHRFPRDEQFSPSEMRRAGGSNAGTSPVPIGKVSSHHLALKRYAGSGSNRLWKDQGAPGHNVRLRFPAEFGRSKVAHRISGGRNAHAMTRDAESTKARGHTNELVVVWPGPLVAA